MWTKKSRERKKATDNLVPETPTNIFNLAQAFGRALSRVNKALNRRQQL